MEQKTKSKHNYPTGRTMTGVVFGWLVSGAGEAIRTFQIAAYLLQHVQRHILVIDEHRFELDKSQLRRLGHPD
ncbi:MAG: hypothetical protein AAF496_16975, partial [Pseudomonadota bacterium]